MPEEWSRKRERQYQHTKDGQLDKGASEDEAEEIAARTVNKTRAQKGESEEASRTSVEDKSPSERGGERSHSGAQGRTKDQLYEDAKRRASRGGPRWTRRSCATPSTTGEPAAGRGPAPVLRTLEPGPRQRPMSSKPLAGTVAGM